MVHARRSDGPALQGRRILVVEDEMLVAMEFESVLRREGCKVLGPVPTIARALATLDQERPDAAVLDLNLGGQPATPVAEALSAHDVPFVVVTGYGAAHSGEPALNDAPRVSKPIQHAELIRVVADLLEAGPSG